MTFWPRPPKANLLRPAPDWVPPPVMHGVNVLHAPMVDLHDRLNKLWNSGTNHDRALCRGLLLQLLVEVLDDDTQAHEQTASSSGLAGAARRVLGQLSQPGDDPTRSIQTAFSRLGYSYAHVCRVFRNAYGITPVGYVNSLRLERARMLILDTQLSIAEISKRVGYDNPAYFGRLFRKNAGRTPRQYRLDRGPSGAGRA